MAKKNEIIIPDTGEIVEVPAFLQEGSEGTEHIGKGDVEIPMVKLLQATSPGLNEHGWRAGNFVHTIMEQEIPGGEGFRIVVITALRKSYVLFNPLDQGGGILARARDGVHWEPANKEFPVKINKGTKEVVWRTADTVAESGLGDWGSYDPDDVSSLPAADLQYQYICVSPDYPDFGPFLIRLQRSGIRAAKALNFKLNRMVGGNVYPAYSKVFVMSSEWEDKGPDDKKFVWRFKPDGLVQDEKMYRSYERLYQEFKDVDVENVVVSGDADSFVDELRPGETIDSAAEEALSEDF